MPALPYPRPEPATPTKQLIEPSLRLREHSRALREDSRRLRARFREVCEPTNRLTCLTPPIDVPLHRT